MALSYVVVHLAETGVLTVFGDANGNPLDLARADAVAARVRRTLGGDVHVQPLVAS